MRCFDMKTRSSEYYPTSILYQILLNFYLVFNMNCTLTIDIELSFTLIFYVRQFCHTYNVPNLKAQ